MSRKLIKIIEQPIKVGNEMEFKVKLNSRFQFRADKLHAIALKINLLESKTLRSIRPRMMSIQWKLIDRSELPSCEDLRGVARKADGVNDLGRGESLSRI